MSKPLNGCVRSHADTSSLPFNSAQALDAHAGEYPLAEVTGALASNDPKRVSKGGDSLGVCLREAESIMRLGCDLLRLSAENKDAHLLSDPSDVVAALTLASSVVSLCADAQPAIDDANLILRGGCHE